MILFLEVAAYKEMHPEKEIISLGIGDVTQPLAPAVIEALHSAVEAIYIDWINRVGYCNNIILRKNIYNIAGVALCAVTNENFIQRDLYATLLVVIFRNGFAQKTWKMIRFIGSPPLI